MSKTKMDAHNINNVKGQYCDLFLFYGVFKLSTCFICVSYLIKQARYSVIVLVLPDCPNVDTPIKDGIGTDLCTRIWRRVRSSISCIT